MARPGLHVVLGLLFFIAFCWPFLAFTTPSHTFVFLHLAWIGAVIVLLLLGIAERLAPPEEEPDDPAADARAGRG